MRSINALRPVALTVSMDEPALRVQETVKRRYRRGRAEDRRVLGILFIRNDEVHEYSEDLGPSKNFPGEPFIIIADAEPIGPLLEMAEKRRWATPLCIEQGIAPVDLIGAFRRAVEEAVLEAKHASVSGPFLTKQR